MHVAPQAQRLGSENGEKKKKVHNTSLSLNALDFQS